MGSNSSPVPLVSGSRVLLTDFPGRQVRSLPASRHEQRGGDNPPQRVFPKTAISCECRSVGAPLRLLGGGGSFGEQLAIQAVQFTSALLSACGDDPSNLWKHLATQACVRASASDNPSNRLLACPCVPYELPKGARSFKMPHSPSSARACLQTPVSPQARR